MQTDITVANQEHPVWYMALMPHYPASLVLHKAHMLQCCDAKTCHAGAARISTSAARAWLLRLLSPLQLPAS